MMLDVKQVSKLLSVPEKTIYRWISRKEIPVYKIGGSLRFNRVELLEWANLKKIKISSEIFKTPMEQQESMPSLVEALDAGGIYYDVLGKDREAVLAAIVNLIPLPADVDKAYLVGALLARENLGSTAVGNGIAIPHVRYPIIYNVNEPILALCFLENAIDFKALDGKAVNTVFTIITHTVRSHLHLLSHLSYALHQPELMRLLNRRTNRQQLVDAFAAFEASLKSNSGDR